MLAVMAAYTLDLPITEHAQCSLGWVQTWALISQFLLVSLNFQQWTQLQPC